MSHLNHGYYAWPSQEGRILENDPSWSYSRHSSHSAFPPLSNSWTDRPAPPAPPAPQYSTYIPHVSPSTLPSLYYSSHQDGLAPTATAIRDPSIRRTLMPWPSSGQATSDFIPQQSYVSELELPAQGIGSTCKTAGGKC